MRGNVRFEYNSTTLDLVIQSLDSGARVGDILLTPGLGRAIIRWELVPTGGGDRTPGGAWAKRLS